VLIELAKQVATSTAQLVLKAKTVSGTCEEQALRDSIIHSATQCAFATSQLVACTKIVAPTIDSQACQEQLTDAAKQVMRAVEQLLRDAEMCKEKKPVGDLIEAARQVTTTLDRLLSHIKAGPRTAASVIESGTDLDTIMTSADRLITYTGPTKEMIRQAKFLAEASTHLVSYEIVSFFFLIGRYADLSRMSGTHAIALKTEQHIQI
jgi:talin